MKVHVSCSYQTAAGNLGEARFDIEAADELAAMKIAEVRLRADRRRSMVRGLDMSASAYQEAER